MKRDYLSYMRGILYAYASCTLCHCFSSPGYSPDGGVKGSRHQDLGGWEGPGPEAPVPAARFVHFDGVTVVLLVALDTDGSAAWTLDTDGRYYQNASFVINQNASFVICTHLPNCRSFHHLKKRAFIAGITSNSYPLWTQSSRCKVREMVPCLGLCFYVLTLHACRRVHKCTHAKGWSRDRIYPTEQL